MRELRISNVYPPTPDGAVEVGNIVAPSRGSPIIPRALDLWHSPLPRHSPPSESLRAGRRLSRVAPSVSAVRGRWSAPSAEPAGTPSGEPARALAGPKRLFASS